VPEHGLASSRPWIVAQIGAREHYAIPRALHENGYLKYLYTDAWCASGHSVLRRAPDPIRSFANRYHPDLSDATVRAFTIRTLWKEFRHRTGETTDEERYDQYIETGQHFATKVRDDLLVRDDFDPDTSVYFGYDTGCLETLIALQETGCLTIVDQMDPGRVEKEIVLEEAEQWPGWASQLPVLHEAYWTRRAREWERASLVVVNSEWSREALKRQGVREEKISILPLAYETPSQASISVRPSSENTPLTVLWLGNVILRKGIQYLIQAARHLKKYNVEIRVVGPIGIRCEAIQSAPDNVTFFGPVARDQTSSIYQSADVFVLPTLSDGFAITQLEAMAHGLPVIATPRCGRVVEDGKDGFVIPPRDEQSLAEAIAKLADDREQIRKMGKHALSKAQQYTLNRIAKELISIADERLQS